MKRIMVKQDLVVCNMDGNVLQKETQIRGIFESEIKARKFIAQESEHTNALNRKYKANYTNHKVYLTPLSVAKVSIADPGAKTV